MGIFSKLAAKLGITEEDAKEIDEFLTASKGEQTKKTGAELPDISELVHNKKAIESLVELLGEREKEIAELRKSTEEGSKKLTAYEQEKADRERLLEDEKKKQLQQRVADKLKEAVDAGKIPAANDELLKTYEKMLVSDFEGATKIIEALPSPKTPASGTKPTQTTQTQQKATFDQLIEASRDELKIT